MKNAIYLVLLVVFMSSCATTVPIAEQLDRNTAKKHIGKIEYTCNIQTINNAMPTMSSETKGSLYSVINLSSQFENLRENWKIKRFEFEGKVYDQFDISSFAGKGELAYRNVVREITAVSRSSVFVKIQFENDKGDFLDFEFGNASVETVY